MKTQYKQEEAFLFFPFGFFLPFFLFWTSVVWLRQFSVSLSFFMPAPKELGFLT